MARVIKGLFHIKVVAGTQEGRLFLSVKKEGGVDLWGHDDGSGRQQWQVLPFDNSKGKQCYHIQPEGSELFLCSKPDGTAVTLTQSDTTSGRERWVLEEAEAGPHGYFHIKILKGTPENKQFLSVNWEGTWVDLYEKDDGEGRQRWRLVPVPSVLVTVNFDLIHAHDGKGTGKYKWQAVNTYEGSMSQEIEKSARVSIGASGIPFLEAGLEATIKQKASSSLTLTKAEVVEIDIDLEDGKPLYFYKVQIVFTDPKTKASIVRGNGTLTRGEPLPLLEIPL